MKRRSERIVLWVGALLMTLQPTLGLAQGEPMSLPKSWYVLPEDANGGNQDQPFTPARKDNADMAKTFDFLVDSQLGALDGVVENESFQEDENSFSANDHSWHLFGAAFDIGASASGLIGLLMLKGEALVNMYWNRVERPPNAKAPQPDSNSDGSMGLTFTEPLTLPQLQQKLTPLINAVMATGKVRDRGRFETDLTEQAKQFNSMVEGLLDDPHTEWWPARLRFDLAVAGSGQVYPGVSVGGGLKIRFDWFPTPGAQHFRQDHYSEAGGKLGHNFNKFLRTIAHELRLVDWEAFPTPKDMAVTQIHITLGLYGDFKIGIAKVNGSVQGSVYFAKRRNPGFLAADDDESFLASLDDDIALIETSSPASHQEFAKNHGIAYTRYEDSARGDRDVYSLPRDLLTKGLNKSTQIATFMAERANQRKSAHWYLNQIRAQFALSLAGTAGVVTIGGTGALQLIIDRMSRPLAMEGGL